MKKQLFQKYLRCQALKIFLFCACLFSVNALQAQTPVEQYGQLKVSGNKIVSEKTSQPVVLRGMSLFWSQWLDKYYNENTLKWLRDDWCADVIRAAMAVDSNGQIYNDGYAAYPDREKAKITTVVDAAIDLGMYVIIDFHSHQANAYLPEAITFFKEMAIKYKDKPNVLYEIWNEPMKVGWSNVVKPYCETVIDTIRKYDPDNIIICGTPSWSQNVDEASQDAINKPNIAYTLHFYATTHKQWLRNKAEIALDNGIALFVTEYGTCESSGDGVMDEEETQTWWGFLEEHKISYCNWSVADKDETAAALMPGASINGNWTESDLSPSGKFVRAQMISKCDKTTGIRSGNAANEMHYYPNPFSNTMNIVLKEYSTYTVLDVLGKVAEQGAGEGKITIGQALKPGTYILKIKGDNKESVLKINKF